MRRWPEALSTALLAASIGAAQAAPSLEGALMPGPVITGHAKLENDCANCHERFNKAGQDRLCIDCHKPVAADLRQHRGYHGRIDASHCRNCHTDHKGREARVVVLDERAFDHSRTDFALGGGHVKAACATCHLAGKKFREAPAECNACHRTDDPHKGALGSRCADCHDDTRWKSVRFDHARTRFPLAGKHAPAPCRDCHRDASFKGAPLTCVGCHREDDKQHRGRLGEKCDACHTAGGWREVSFNHDRDTTYPLKGKHRGAKCEACHASPPSRNKTPTDCIACHRNDDKHAGSLGPKCADCHGERSWKETRIDHDRTRFSLLAKHRDVECAACHRDTRSFKGAPLECNGCHAKDDKHRARFGPKCESCHTAQSWRDVSFRHDRDTRFALRGKHASTGCDACHAGRLYEDKVGTQCVACHAKDDRHKAQLGTNCASCHAESTWKVGRFDHAATRFALSGSHVRVQCASCHKTLAYRDAPRDCIGCHETDDKHRKALGRDCALCHNARSWRAWDFDHNRQSRFVLDGAHVKVACSACHVKPVEGPLQLGAACIDCHRRDDKHEGAFGPACERCHVTRSFRELRLPSVRGSSAAEGDRR
jgi:hypothetical protein